MSSNGMPLSGANGYVGGGLGNPLEMGIDPSGNVWLVSDRGVGVEQAVTKFDSSGAPLSGANGFTLPNGAWAGRLALDGQGNAWISNNHTGSSSVIEMDNNGNLLSPGSGFPIGGGWIEGIAIDRAGNVWTSNGSAQTVSKLDSEGTLLSGTGYPVTGLVPTDIAFDGS